MFLLLALVAAADPLHFSVVVSDAPLDAPQKAPLLSLFSQKGTAAFFKPLVARIEARRGAPPSDKLRVLLSHQACGGFGAIRLGVDMAAYMGELAETTTPDRLRHYTDLGLSEADTLAICITPASNELHIAAVLTVKQWRGLLAALGPNAAIFDRAPLQYYWAGEAMLDAQALLASVGGGRSGAQAVLGAVSGFIGQDLRSTVVDKLTGRVRAALAQIAPRETVRYAELSMRDTRGAEQALQTLEALAPHLPMNGAPPHSIGVDVGLATFSPSLPLYLRAEKNQLTVASTPAGLEVKTKTQAAQTAALAATFDVARYAALYKRVGRPDDVREWVADFSADDWVDAASAPEPAALLAGMAKMRVNVKKNDNQLVVDILISR